MMTAPAGDVNGDGREDVIVGSVGADANQRLNSGSAFVVFSRAKTTSVNLNQLGKDGFRIDGARPGQRIGDRVGSVGDLNRDGFGDIFVTTYPDYTNAERGRTYIIFGKKGRTRVDLAKSKNVIEIIARDGSNDEIIGAVALGRHNQDRRSELAIVTSRWPEYGNRIYVVFLPNKARKIRLGSFPKSYPVDVPASTLGVPGARPIIEPVSDVNADGRPDWVIGDANADPSGRVDAGSVYLLYGTPSLQPLNLAALSSSNGYRIDGAAARDGFGWDLARNNNLGSPGIAVLAPQEGSSGNGAVYGFGLSPSATQLSAATSAAWQTISPTPGLGAIANIGDQNGDGRDDFALGNESFDGARGVAQLICGPSTTQTLRSPSGPSSIIGPAPLAGLTNGGNLHSLADQNRDGRRELLVGAPGTTGARASAYVVRNLNCSN
jgi:hypothetical protein